MSPRFLKLTLATLTALTLAPSAHAASNFAQGGGNLSTSVNLNFSIVIPRFVYFRVGSAASVNTLIYSPTPAQMAASTGVLATGGDLGGGTDVAVQVTSNAGNVTLTAVTGTATLLNGANTMAWSTLTPSNPTGSIVAPPFNTGNTVLNASGGIVNQTGSWRYTWTNPPATVYAAGTYSGTVTYTAATP